MISNAISIENWWQQIRLFTESIHQMHKSVTHHFDNDALTGIGLLRRRFFRTFNSLRQMHFQRGLLVAIQGVFVG